ncbi:LytTR family transcriptional regulator [Sporosarcina sp. P21c]|uniref:LytTR family DNA-binding domain-containing protein n=1 Tax=unclassified Sporosarcina TaxID=2647733 RepID=UPI000C171A41|nr:MULTISPECIES: LytTR family DNA-binding domain-containing protein [unclassified Sporosarcina]PIC66668.1 LytTR family transcriptional regulator [Sporosarcina sp. P16a]PIC88455.1 LytTR family transcriptional regulator [Sporosarcina sp. P21c]PIC91617.1 LytTR family transcriptional regulator [Sporosarcina sp. P25]
MTTIRLKIEESTTFQEIEITIKCPEVDERLSRLIQQINQMMYSFTVTQDDAVYSIPSSDVLYIETVDNASFLYTQEDVYESELKLYEFENQLKNTRFLRVSKHMMVNTSKIESVRALLNGRFEATLENGEMVIVNRHYAKIFRKHFLG